MTSIVYNIIANFGECAEFIGDGSTNVRVEIKGLDGGSIVIGDRAARLPGGIAHLDLSSLPDGEYTPAVFATSKRIPLEKIKIRDGRLSRVVIDQNLIERLLLRVRELECDRDELSRRLEICESAIRPKTLF